MKHIKLDREIEPIKAFIRSLPREADGAILELEGKPLLKVTPVLARRVDKRKLKAAILKRRDESRKLNAEWNSADQDLWNQTEAKE